MSIKNTDKLLMPLHKTFQPNVYQVGVSSLKMKIEEETHCGTQFSKMKCRKSLSQVIINIFFCTDLVNKKKKKDGSMVIFPY